MSPGWYFYAQQRVLAEQGGTAIKAALGDLPVRVDAHFRGPLELADHYARGRPPLKCARPTPALPRPRD